MVRHAHAKEDKEARRDDILGAALALFLKDTRRLPPVAAIAAEAGLAKGTVYIYFETKEQIFASLLYREWDALLAEVALSFAEGSGPSEVLVARFIARFSEFL
jgi:AcrR family transcriptional regulator